MNFPISIAGIVRLVSESMGASRALKEQKETKTSEIDHSVPFVSSLRKTSQINPLSS
ncbi:hypothetical protein Pla144_40670 [Bythopirellula polymerisocia]|uniref:Uncharacterized protein n=1 Tax=Bythopirellula polymerisocia TaxID=2528003 RepID=A0A5C6CFS4_9BACT|nr:hypothetical protein Pla144_40670 [Bythopirellula polymerisocia]